MRVFPAVAGRTTVWFRAVRAITRGGWQSSEAAFPSAPPPRGGARPDESLWRGRLRPVVCARTQCARGHAGLAGASPPRPGAIGQFAPSHMSACPLRLWAHDDATSLESTHDRLSLWRGYRAYPGNRVSRVRPLGCRGRRARAAPARGRRPHRGAGSDHPDDRTAGPYGAVPASPKSAPR